MSTVDEQLNGATITATRQRLEQAIAARPAEADRRAELVQWLCLEGNWSRALRQLQSWRALTPQAQPTLTLLQQMIEGEQRREQVLAGAARPAMPEAHWPWLTLLAQAAATAATLTDADGRSQRAAWLMDGDARLGPVCELLMHGRYGWLPFDAITTLTFQPPSGVFDLIWRQAHLRLADGSEQLCQIPARYPLTAHSDDRHRLARVTDWQALDETGEGWLGNGQKVWLNDEQAFPLLTLTEATFDAGEDHDLQRA